MSYWPGMSCHPPKQSNPKLVSASLAPVGVFSGFSMRFVEEETEARGVCVLLSMAESRGPPPLARFCLG